MSMNTTDDEETVFYEYDEYTKIENHIFLSRCLYELDQKSKHILRQLSSKKTQGRRKRSNNPIFSEDISLVYSNILLCSSVRRLRAYFCLQYFLDELLYHEVKNTQRFHVEDHEYPISKLYFSQSEWIADASPQPFEFYEEPEFNIHESMYIVCYLKEFDGFLLDVEEYIKPLKDIRSIKSKLRETVHRIRCRHKNVWNVVLSTINHNISGE